MNLIPSIHDTQVDQIVAETHQQSEIERSHLTDMNIELYSTGFFGLIGVKIPVSETPMGSLASLMAS